MLTGILTIVSNMVANLLNERFTITESNVSKFIPAWNVYAEIAGEEKVRPLEDDHIKESLNRKVDEGNVLSAVAALFKLLSTDEVEGAYVIGGDICTAEEAAQYLDDNKLDFFKTALERKGEHKEFMDLYKLFVKECIGQLVDNHKAEQEQDDDYDEDCDEDEDYNEEED